MAPLEHPSEPCKYDKVVLELNLVESQTSRG